jgi:peptidoglycan-associated lipoprotein
MFPWISADGTLYFSGDEHAGFGGLDIFFCRSQGNSWEIPVNAGSPLNSPADDFAAVITGSKACTDHACGFFSSNRPGGKGGDDIWGFRLLPAPPSSPPLAAMPPAIAEKPSDVPEAYSVGKTYRIENIYYDFDKWNIRKDAEKSLDSLLAILREYPIIVEIGSHTDCRGSGEYNQVLSERRAASVVSYLVGKGIDPSRLSFKGYGKTRLINACDCEKGHECSEAMHQANRRTEFTVTGYKTAPSSASEKNIILRK